MNIPPVSYHATNQSVENAVTHERMDDPLAEANSERLNQNQKQQLFIAQRNVELERLLMRREVEKVKINKAQEAQKSDKSGAGGLDKSKGQGNFLFSWFEKRKLKQKYKELLKKLGWSKLLKLFRKKKEDSSE